MRVKTFYAKLRLDGTAAISAKIPLNGRLR